MRPNTERIYRVRLWTGGEPGKGQSVLCQEQPGHSADEARAKALERARKLFPATNWAVGGAEWRRDAEVSEQDAQAVRDLKWKSRR